MARTAAQLTLPSLAKLFGVGPNAIYLWRQGTPTKEALEAPYTPARLKAWAKKHGVEMTCDPQKLLDKPVTSGKRIGRPPASEKTAKKVLKRSGSGKLSGVQPARKAREAAHASA